MGKLINKQDTIDKIKKDRARCSFAILLYGSRSLRTTKKVYIKGWLYTAYLLV